MKLKIILLTAIANLGLLVTTMAQVTVTISANGPTTICSGNSIQLNSNVSPIAVYQYQWVKNGIDIFGANVAFPESLQLFSIGDKKQILSIIKE